MQPNIAYKPYAERTPDYQYHNLLEHIMRHGKEVTPIQGDRTRMILGAQFRFDMKNGFPLLTERDLSGNRTKAALGEHIAFLNGARTHEELKKFGCPYWAPWVTEEKCSTFGLPAGDLGDASYGAIWHDFPSADGSRFNQIKAAVELFKRGPHLRTNRITPWYPPLVIGPQGTRKVVVAPCHGDIHIFGYPETKELSIHHFQRSGDLPVGVAFNLIQYAAFGLMLADVTGYTFSELVYTFSDVHIYERQYEKVEELLARKPEPFPTVTLNTEVESIFDYRPEDFTIEDYHPHPWMAIPTPV